MRRYIAALTSIVGDRWVMFYFGLAADGYARESIATSNGLLTWTKSGGVLLDAGRADAVDALHAHKPAVSAVDGVLEHYYTAVLTQQPVDIAGYAQAERRAITRAREPARS